MLRGVAMCIALTIVALSLDSVFKSFYPIRILFKSEEVQFMSWRTQYYRRRGMIAYLAYIRIKKNKLLAETSSALCLYYSSAVSGLMLLTQLGE